MRRDDTLANVVRSLARAIAGEPRAIAALAEGLAAWWAQGHKSLALRVRFTGFFWRDELVGGADPLLVRAAQQCILARIDRLGVRPSAGDPDLEALVRAIRAGSDARTALERDRPRGIYAGFADGTVYRPPDERPGPAAAATDTADEEARDWTAFEFVDNPWLSGPLAAPSASEPSSTPTPNDEQDEWYGLFRSATAPVQVPLERGLVECDNIAQYNDLWLAWVAEVQQATAAGDAPRVAELLQLARSELTRSDRRRPFLEIAAHALRTVLDEVTLRQWTAWAVENPPWRRLIADLFPFAGDAAVPALERLLGTLPDAGDRAVMVAAAMQAPHLEARLLERVSSDTYGARARLWVEALMHVEVPLAVRQRWLETLARHAEPAVRAAVAQAAHILGARSALRLLVDLVGDRERLVRREALDALGRLRDPAAVPFLARVASEDPDEEVQLAAIAALGATQLPDAIAPLRSLLERRARLSFGARRQQRRRAAALEALARLRLPAARAIVEALAASSDELAPLAARLQRAAE